MSRSVQCCSELRSRSSSRSTNFASRDHCSDISFNCSRLGWPVMRSASAMHSRACRRQYSARVPIE
jgi:hypothetical protein